jgi:hypothetical protein
MNTPGGVIVADAIPPTAQQQQRPGWLYLVSAINRAWPGMRRYGAIVLGVECLGASTTFLYGLNIILDPVHESLIDDPENPGLTKVRLSPIPPPFPPT